ncbi:MAG: SdrD B-like domain-containing protein [Pirellulaceae bacterium]
MYDGGQKTGTTGGDASGLNTIIAIPLMANEHSLHNDFCELPPGSISGYVHVDDDGDCIIDPEERRLADVEMKLYAANGTLVATTFTNSEGFYEFKDLAPGSYSVVQTQPGGLFDGVQKAGTTGGDASGINRIDAISLLANQHSLHNDFCESLGQHQWLRFSRWLHASCPPFRSLRICEASVTASELLMTSHWPA